MMNSDERRKKKRCMREKFDVCSSIADDGGLDAAEGSKRGKEWGWGENGVGSGRIFLGGLLTDGTGLGIQRSTPAQ